MKLGLYGLGSGACADPDTAEAVARAADAAGFESLWTGEHIVLPDPQAPPSPAKPDFPMLHPATALSFLAGVTRHVKLGSGVVLIGQHNPVVVAKEFASVDVVSRGRLIFGVGVGYLEPEFRALGVPFEERAARTDEGIAVVRTLWTQDKPSFDGRFSSFANIRSLPMPVQKPHPPIVVGGASRAAFRRAVTIGNGWYGFALDEEKTIRCMEGLRAAQRECQRPADLGPLEITVTPSAPLDRDAVQRFEELGVHRLVPLTRGRSREQVVAFTEGLANDLSLSSRT